MALEVKTPIDCIRQQHIAVPGHKDRERSIKARVRLLNKHKDRLESLIWDFERAINAEHARLAETYGELPE